MSSNLIVFIPNNEQKLSTDNNFELFKLIHPSSGILSFFCIRNNELYELKQLSNENERSWFIENNVKEEGSFYCISPFDPLFILINVFEKMKDKKDFFQQLDIILYNDEIPSYSLLSQINNIEDRIKNICDINVINIQSNEAVYKFNETKVLNWLNKKVQNICEKFENFSLCMNILKKFDSSTEDIEIKKKRIAVILMSEYLSVKWSIKLKNSLNLPEPIEKENNYVYAEEEFIYSNSKRNIVDEPIKEAKKKKTNLTPGQQRLAKANKSGMKSLEFFFKKK